MDMFTVAAITTGTTTVISFVTCLIGYNISEKRHAAAIEVCRSYWKGNAEIHEEYRKKFALDAQAYKLACESETKAKEEAEARANNLVMDLEIALVNAGKWEAKCDALHASLQGTEQQLADARRMYTALEAMLADAQDPNGAFAKRMITRGVRKANKKARAKAEARELHWKNLMAQSETILELAEEECAKLHTAQELLFNALLNTAKDKIGLIGVRTAFIQAYWNEVARLRAVEAKKGE